ncbi:MAG: DUF819 family protein [Verrucomicrobia bacterium]|nr:DUF819 family protein [Verrucomicrobiota bacterium]MBI3870695.1 DUF819 family protein [Verrucomicrobiota bacterium]
MPFLNPDDTWPLMALMVAGTTLSIWMEQRFRWAAKLSAPVIALLVAMALTNARVMPMESPAYDFVGKWLVPLALPLLLFRANFMDIARRTGKMMIAFHISSLGTMLGAVLAFWLLRHAVPEPAKAAGIMTGSYIGGMINFMAISESTRAAGSMTSSLIVADNLVMAALFLALLWIAGSPFFLRHFAHEKESDAAGAQNKAAAHWDRKGIALLDIGKSLAVASAVVAAAMLLKKSLDVSCAAQPADSRWLAMGKVLATNHYVLITALSLAVSTVFARPLAAVNGPEELGSFILYLFLFTIGLPADLMAVLFKSPVLFAFCGIIAFTNLFFTLVLGKIFRLKLEDLLLSVNATVGGPPTAAAMAISKGWANFVLPGILVGIWGYIIGTPLGLFITSWLSP